MVSGFLALSLPPALSIRSLTPLVVLLFAVTFAQQLSYLFGLNCVYVCARSCVPISALLTLFLPSFLPAVSVFFTFYTDSMNPSCLAE